MIRSYIPTSPGIRHKRKFIADGSFEVESRRKGSSVRGSGRSHGTVSVRGRGGGHKHRRLIVTPIEEVAKFPEVTILQFVKDSRRGAGLLKLVESLKGFPIGVPMLFPRVDLLEVGMTLKSGVCDPTLSLDLGMIAPLSRIEFGQSVCCIGGKYLRSAGVYGVVHQKTEDIVTVKCGGRYLKFPASMLAVVGRISNMSHYVNRHGKAGARRHLGFRPKVRGVAMNPVDHPHGGGEGKTSGGRPSVSPWGWLTKGWRRK